METPWASDDWLQWRIYADWLYDQGVGKPRAKRSWLRALRFAKGFRKSRWRLLVSDAPATASARRLLDDGGVPFLPGTVYQVMPKGGVEWRQFGRLRWLTDSFLFRQQEGRLRPPGGGRVLRPPDIIECRAHPKDFPGMMDAEHRHLALSFYYAVSRGILLEERDGVVWQLTNDRGGGFSRKVLTFDEK